MRRIESTCLREVCAQTFNPVVKIAAVRLLLSIVVTSQWEIRQLDVSNAFLHGNLEETVYMEQLPGFIHSHLSRMFVCYINHSMASAKHLENGSNVSTHISLSWAFFGLKTDTSLFYCKMSQSVPFVLIYVDVILVTGNNPGGVHTLIHSLQAELAIRDLGAAHYFLGIELQPHPTGCLLI